MKMKRLISLLLSVIMLLCMAACGGKNPEAPTRPSENSSQPTGLFTHFLNSSLCSSATSD